MGTPRGVLGTAPHPGVGVGDELVQVLKPQVGVLVVEVGAHGHQDVVGAVLPGLGTAGTQLGTPARGRDTQGQPGTPPQGTGTPIPPSQEEQGPVGTPSWRTGTPTPSGLPQFSPLRGPSPPLPPWQDLGGRSLQEGGDHRVHVALRAVAVHHGGVSAELVPAQPGGGVVHVGQDPWGQRCHLPGNHGQGDRGWGWGHGWDRTEGEKWEGDTPGDTMGPGERGGGHGR